MQSGAPQQSTGLMPAVWLLVGVALVFLYALGESYLPRGGQEFVYDPCGPRAWIFNPMRGFTVEQLARHVGALLLLAPGALLITWALLRQWSVSPGALDLPAFERLTVRGMFATGGLATLASGFLIFRGRAITDDELAYGHQADLLRRGRVVEVSDLPLLDEPFTVQGPTGWTGKYLFGEPLVQVPGLLVDMPWLLHLPLSMVTLWAVYKAVSLERNQRIARFTAAFLAISPMFCFAAGTGLSHTTCLATITLATWGALRCKHGHFWSGAALVGLGLGAGLTVRPQVAMPMGAVLAAMTLFYLWRAGGVRSTADHPGQGSDTAPEPARPGHPRAQLGPVALAAVLGLAFVALIGLYNHAVTGSPWKLPWDLQAFPEQYGLGHVREGFPYQHTFLAGLQNLLTSMLRLNSWWLGWPLALLVPGVWIWLRDPRLPGAWIGAFGWPAVATVVFHFGYYSPGVSDVGPVYYFELLLPLSVLAGHTAALALDSKPRLAAVGLTVQLVVGTLCFDIEQGRRLLRLVTSMHDAPGKIYADLQRRNEPMVLLHERYRGFDGRVGWLQSGFPIRKHDPDASVITFARNPMFDHVAAFADVLPHRACGYLYHDPAQGAHVVMPCESAPWLRRGAPPPGPGEPPRCTAVTLGLHDPDGGLHEGEAPKKASAL